MNMSRGLGSVLLLLILNWRSAHGAQDTTICKQRVQKEDKTIPPLPESYEADFELTKRHLHQIQFVTEVYDSNERRGAVTTYYNGGQNKVIHDLRTVMRIEGMNYEEFLAKSECRVFHFDSNRDNIFLDYTNEAKNTTHSARTDGLVQYNKASLIFEYIGPAEVRGIPAESWITCYYSDDIHDATFEIEVFWSTEQASVPSGDSRVPLRITMTGKFKPEGDPNFEKVDDVYDIVWFKADPSFKEEMFLPPLGVYCTDDILTKDFPDMGEAFSVDIENIFEGASIKNEQAIKYQTLQYNLDTKLLRLDYESVSPKEIAQFNSVELITIRDYTIGVEYTMDKFRTNCVAASLKINKAPTLQSIFFENIDNYEYLGKYEIRDMTCDVWVGKGRDGLTVQWAFLDDSWKEEGDSGQESRVPIQTVWYNWTNKARETRNFFSFRRDPAPDDFDQFDVSPCFTEAEKRHFQIAFRVDDPDKVNLEELKRNARSTIPNLIHVSAVRVDQVEVEYKQETSLVYLEFTLLDRPLGNNLPASDQDVPLKEAIESLSKYVREQSFILSVSLPGSAGENQELHALSDSLRELEGPKGPCGAPEAAPAPLRLQHSYKAENYQQSPESQLRYSALESAASANTQSGDTMDKYNAGQLAGLAVGMFVLGGALGIIAMLLLLLHIDRSRGAQDGLRLCDKEATAASSPQDFSPVTETSVD